MSAQVSKKERVARWVVPLLLIGLSIIAIYYTTTFKKMPPILKRGIQPSDFPQLICGLIIVLTGLMAWLDPIRISGRMTVQTWMTFGALAVFALLMQIDLFLALGVFAAGLSVLWGERRPHMIGFVGVVTPVAIFFLFDLVFRIRFPRGLLTDLWYG